MKKLIFTLAGIAIINTSFSQTVFTYGKNAVSKDEFVRAFNKNPNTAADRKKALKEYLDLYTNFKLKVQAAYDEGLDKDATQEYELQNFKRQIADNIINEQANIKMLVKEAFDRLQSEINVAQIFVEVAPDGDSVTALKTITNAYNALKQGDDFGETSAVYSTDEATRQSKGQLGFITAFSLPYEIESVIYNLKPGTYSAPYRSKIGYHIFKNVNQRKSQGSRKVAQILIAMPPNPTESQKEAAAKKADSVYRMLIAGDNFSTMVAAVSNDLSTAANKGELEEFTTGTFNSTFENVAFGLKKTGDISQPFETQYGYHILKLIEAKEVPADMNDGTAYASIQDKVIKDARLEKAKKRLIESKYPLIKYKAAVFNQNELFEYTDSALNDKSTKGFKTINENTLLFSFAKQNIKVSDWVKYAKAAQLNTEDYKSKIKESYKGFVRISAEDYYRNNMADYNADFSRQVTEFKEANLLFGIMDKMVWSKANNDSAGLASYYNEHKQKYIWPPSADALIVTCGSEKLTNEIQQKLKDNISNWREITGNNGADVMADSGRYEYTQLPLPQDVTFSDKMMTSPVKNANDNTFTFSYILHAYPEAGQRSFEDARGMVITDYQQVLETKWIELLRKKYPVKINTAVFDTIK